MDNILTGTRVMDFTRVFAGPAATQILGDMGADVVKVEAPGGDEARYYGVTAHELEDVGGSSPSFIALNRNKRSIEIDLRQPEGKAVAQRLASDVDVVVHNFRPGVMEWLGLGYDELPRINPKLVYAGFSAYGRTGPLAHVGANDLALQAHSGLISITGEADRPPVRAGSSIVDLHGSLALSNAVLAALLHRQQTGKGQRIETSLLLSSAHLMCNFYTEYWMMGMIRERMGTANHLSVPNQVIPASDGDIVIVASSDDLWSRWAAELDPERLAKPEFGTAFLRRQNRVALVETLSEITARYRCSELIERLGRAKVVVSKVNSTGEAADDPQLAAIGGRIVLDKNNTDLASVALPFHFETLGSNPGAPPAWGSIRPKSWRISATRKLKSQPCWQMELLLRAKLPAAVGRPR